uniref:Uncharacterized protein n=1 Tax=Echeneis naucrates TaxID=173247 RepID=A0A665X6U6_ECHNA
MSAFTGTAIRFSRLLLRMRSSSPDTEKAPGQTAWCTENKSKPHSLSLQQEHTYSGNVWFVWCRKCDLLILLISRFLE